MSKLLMICAEKDKEFGIFSEKIKELNPLYIESRYPQFMDNILKSDAKKAMKTAEEISSFVKSKLS